MGITKTIGGNRLGSGNKMNVHLHGYGRSSHNLGRAWRSTMAPGTLVPFLVEPTLPGDTFEIDLTTLIRTMPTNGPVFGSFKLQMDVFTCPMRLYNAQLHNNALGIGLNMEKVIFPKLEITGNNIRPEEGNLNEQQINPSSLLAYLGVRGLGKNSSIGSPMVGRNFNAMPLLAYWDIYKNYYANKQEEIGMVISNIPEEPEITYMARMQNIGVILDTMYNDRESSNQMVINVGEDLLIRGVDLNPEKLNIFKTLTLDPGGPFQTQTIKQIGEERFEFAEIGSETIKLKNCKIGFWLTRKNQADYPAPIFELNSAISAVRMKLDSKEFPLEIIDEIRERILQTPKTEPFILNAKTEYPYKASLGTEETTAWTSKSKFEMAGLGLKTYQSDRFNNWLSTEWIDGANGISAVTAVDTSSGAFTIDSLNLAEKVYNMLNRIAVSGGSYTDWQEAVYGTKSMKLAEVPIYMGGLSSEIVFNEIVSTADSKTTSGDEQPLGTLAGRGANTNHKGGKIRIKTQEPSFIIGIVSITPRIDYSQGNKWWTKLETMNDLHKPALDGIGFQELITDELAAWDTSVDDNTTPHYKSAGKQPAWIHYMTAVNETFGNFAKADEEMFMTLNRRYEPDTEGNIKDLTTYIDPSKFNYAFAVQELKAQNFWVQIAMDITARRVMSAKMIPNL